MASGTGLLVGTGVFAGPRVAGAEGVGVDADTGVSVASPRTRLRMPDGPAVRRGETVFVALATSIGVGASTLPARPVRLGRFLTVPLRWRPDNQVRSHHRSDN